MNRAEMVSKLKTIKPTAFPTVITTDMGLEFDVITSKGAYTILGSIGDWPLWKLPEIQEPELGNIITKIRSNTLETEDFKNTKLYSFVKRMKRENGPDLNKLFAPLKNYTSMDGFYYIYCDLGKWEIELKFYKTEEKLTNAFLKSYSDVIPWDKTEDQWIPKYYNEIIERGEGVVIYTLSDVIEEEDTL